MCDCKLSYCGAGLFGYIPYEMQTFDSVCCDLVKSSNIVTVFSTYINIICTCQQTGVILSLATLGPLPQPLFHLKPAFHLPSPSYILKPTHPPSPEDSFRALEVTETYLGSHSLRFQNWGPSDELSMIF